MKNEKPIRTYFPQGIFLSPPRYLPPFPIPSIIIEKIYDELRFGMSPCGLFLRATSYIICDQERRRWPSKSGCRPRQCPPRRGARSSLHAFVWHAHMCAPRFKGQGGATIGAPPQPVILIAGYTVTVWYSTIVITSEPDLPALRTYCTGG